MKLPLLALAFAATLAQAQTPDTIFLNGHILTGVGLTASGAKDTPQFVEAVAIANGTIIATGTSADLRALASGQAKLPSEQTQDASGQSQGPSVGIKIASVQTKIVDLQQAFVMPGFNDAHTHMAEAGENKLTVDLHGVLSLTDMQDRIRRYAASARPGAWLRGGGWDQTLWSTKTLPTRADLDAVTAGHPALFYRVDGHIAIANSVALTAAGITASTPAPGGGAIDLAVPERSETPAPERSETPAPIGSDTPATTRSAAAAPTGIIREAPAIALILAKIPPPGPDQRRRALDIAIADALANGVTSVQDFSDYEDFLALESMEHTGKLKLRFSEWLAFDTPLPTLRERRAAHEANDPLLHLGMLKAFMDGSLGSRTAALEDPYFDMPANSGLPRYPDQDKLNQMASARADAGFQLGFHAIGDRANEIALDAFAAAEQAAVPASAPPPPSDPDSTIVTRSSSAFSNRDLRFRIEHAQVVQPGDFDRFFELGVIASMQPSHLLTDMQWATDRLGSERAKYAYAWRSFLDHGVTLAFGTDYPVESINPFRGLYAAVTRKNETGTQTFHPEQTITIQQAIYAYTQASAYAEYRDRIKGRLEPGYVADLIVLDRDITRSTPQELLQTKVLRTVVNGETVYTAP